MESFRQWFTGSFWDPQSNESRGGAIRRLVKETGISLPTVYRIWHGQRVSIDTATVMAEYTGGEVDVLSMVTGVQDA